MFYTLYLDVSTLLLEIIYQIYRDLLVITFVPYL